MNNTKIERVTKIKCIDKLRVRKIKGIDKLRGKFYYNKCHHLDLSYPLYIMLGLQI